MVKARKLYINKDLCKVGRVCLVIKHSLNIVIEKVTRNVFYCVHLCNSFYIYRKLVTLIEHSHLFENSS